MKKLLVILFVFVITVSCKNEAKSSEDSTANMESVTVKDDKTAKQSDGLIAIQGEFLYSKVDNAAVLKTATQMYGIVIDDNMRELQRQVEQYKADEYSMVPVTIRGRIIKNEKAENEWKKKIEIKEILKISKPTSDESDIIKLGSK